MTLKDKIIKYLADSGVDKSSYRLKYFKCSRYQKRYKPEYQEEECWLYPKEVIKHEHIITKKGQQYRMVDIDGNPIMKSDHGLLITASDFEDKDFMECAFSGFNK